jgi:predicted GH43/DUF377 family glycosyl hydrolase
MKWIKKGRIYQADGSLPWAKKYGFPPTPVRMSDDVLRLYMAFCDENTVGRIGYVDVAADEPSRILKIAQTPVLDIGAPGCFDENGILPTSVIRAGDALYMYYVGYQLGMKVRYYQFEGLAISRDGGESFTRALRVPVIDRSDAELLNRTSAFVMLDGGTFRMWYVGGSEWVHARGKMLPLYNLRYLESRDGIQWGDEGRVVIDFASSDEHAFGRPWIVREGGLYRMFYSVRTHSKGYRLGYAESRDGIGWTRKDDQVGIDVSADGWDSEMIAYSSIAQHGETTYMFYNGNNCGETGFGYAVLESW